MRGESEGGVCRLGAVGAPETWRAGALGAALREGASDVCWRDAGAASERRSLGIGACGRVGGAPWARPVLAAGVFGGAGDFFERFA